MSAAQSAESKRTAGPVLYQGELKRWGAAVTKHREAVRDWVGGAVCEACEGNGGTLADCEECDGSGMEQSERLDLLTLLGHAVQHLSHWWQTAREHRCDTYEGDCGECYGCSLREGFWAVAPEIRALEVLNPLGEGQRHYNRWEARHGK